MLAYDYPLLGVFWSLLWWFVLFAWIVLVFHVITDIFRSHDMGGLAKGLWTLFVIAAPWLGVLIYLIARGGSMRERSFERAQAQEAAFRSYVQDAAAGNGSHSATSELERLADLRERGVLNEAEFAQQKAKLLA